ncbi:hypothetical protein PMAYCL1PPCAC_08939, partial [Pristionchus mayeri]
KVCYLQCEGVLWTDNYTCILLGKENPLITCSAPTKIIVKQLTNCETRTDPMQGMGVDPCISTIAFYPGLLNSIANGICPRDKQYIIRGIDEFGVRVSFDNDINNILTFDTVRNMWKLNFTQTGATQWLVAVSCAITSTNIFLNSNVNGASVIECAMTGFTQFLVALSCSTSEYRSKYGSSFKMATNSTTNTT